MQLPPLPRLDDKLGQLLRGPTECSNWIIPGMLLCGQYPGAFEDRKNDQLLKRILGKGVDTFVCLQEEVDMDIPEDVWRAGIGLRPYFSDAMRLSKKDLKWVHVPIVDGGVAPDDVTAAAVVGLAEDLMAGRILYLHCWGGHGRTGVLACLILAYLYRLKATEVMRRVQVYHDCRIDPQNAKSPQTVMQRDQVRRLVQDMLEHEPPAISIKSELPSVDIDATKRGSMRPLAKSSHTSSCPVLGGTPASVTPTRHQANVRTTLNDHIMPGYLSLPNVSPGASAATRRSEAMRQKSVAAALRRERFAKPSYVGMGVPLVA